MTDDSDGSSVIFYWFIINNLTGQLSRNDGYFRKLLNIKRYSDIVDSDQE